MKKLSELRTEIDSVDAQLVKLLERRMAITDEVGAVKHDCGSVITDLGREREILTSVSKAVRPDVARGVRTVYSAIFNVSKARQRLQMGKPGAEAEVDRSGTRSGACEEA